MVAVAERRVTERKPRETDAHRAPDWRDLLLFDLCVGREGARLRRLMRAYHDRAKTRSCGAMRSQSCTPRRTGYRTRAARVLVALNRVRGSSHERVERHEARIGFALQRVDEARRGDGAPVRADRLRIELAILDHYIERAEALVAVLEADAESRVA